MEDEEADLRNPFPSPPSHYTNYTAHNIKLLERLRQQAGSQSDLSEIDQYALLSDQTDVPEWPLQQLEKPRVDWILEEGQYEVFGDTWHIKDVILSLGESGGDQYYPSDPSVDRRPALLTVLRSLLVSYSQLLDSLLAPPASHDTSPEWNKQITWITVMAQNIMAAANDFRPVQARANLEMMMHRQLELRREETRAIHQKCDTLEAKLEAIRTSVLSSSSAEQQAVTGQAPSSPFQPHGPVVPQEVTTKDVLRWAEEIA